MELDTGTLMGPYEIQRKLGAGGMGVVYRALDSRLGRQVAIKVLPEALKGDVDRMRRFEREARTIGALNHPNLVTLHDVGTHEGTPFLVTELLDGQSLRAKLEEGRIQPREAVRIAGEIARGLAAAHGAGVTHRDIKPENIFVMADDRVKVLDFGIAKLQQKGGEDDGHAATLQGVGMEGTAHTGTGMVVGTPGYMAPEQLGGGDVDARTDIFALGVVLHEMLSGRRPFASDSGIGIEESYAILKQPPTDLPSNIPPAIARVVRRCLEKKPGARFQSASDLAFALEASESSESGPVRSPGSSSEAMAATMAQPAIHDGTPVFTTNSDGIPKVERTTDLGVAPVSAPIASIRKRLQTSPDSTASTGSTTKEVPQLRPIAPSRWPWIAASICALAIGGVVVAIVMRPTAGVTAKWPELVEGGVTYRRVTFLPQPAAYARFTSEQQSVLWSERRGQNWYVVQSGLGAPSMTSTSLVGRVLDVEHETGAVAIRTYGEGEGGTLKRGSSGMGAPELVALHVEDASFGPGGKTFAVIRATDDAQYALEYPIDKVIYKPSVANGSLDFVRVSRDGSAIAVVELDAPPQTSGRVVIVTPDGKVIARSDAYDEIDGVAWRGNREVWFAEGSRIRARSLQGKKDRILHRSALPLHLRDVADDGRMLVGPTTVRARTLLGRLDDKEHKEKNVGWFDGSEVRGISKDGTTIVFVETTAPVHDDLGYPVFRRVGEEPPIALGRARNVAMFPDGLSVLLASGPKGPLRIVREGATNIDLPLGEIDHLDVGDAPAIAWSGRFVVVRGATKDGRMRLWRYDLEAKTPPQPVGPDTVGESPHPISPDGKWIAIADRGKGLQLHSTAGEAMRVAGTGEIVPLSFDETGTVLFAMPLHNFPRPIIKLDLAANTATDVLVIAPDDKPQRFSIAIDATGTMLAYSTILETSELFVIEPTKSK